MRELRWLTVGIYDSVTRISDGITPDEMDRSCLREAAMTMRGEAQMLEWVDGNGVGPLPLLSCLDREYWVDLLVIAVRQLNLHELVQRGWANSLRLLAEALDKISNGDRPEAQKYEAVFARLSILAEMYS